MSFAISMELPLLVLRQLSLHVYELVSQVVSQHHHLGVGIDFDALFRSQVHIALIKN